MPTNIEQRDAIAQRGRAEGLLQLGKDQEQTDPAAAERSFQEAAALFLALGDEHEWAVTKGLIAGILEERGELDEALRILTEEELPVYERQGDVSAQAGVHLAVAGILKLRGDLEGALRIRVEKLLPACRLIGDALKTGAVQSSIAELRAQLGEPDAALQIWQEVLTMLAGLGADREYALTQLCVAGTLASRDADQALSLYRQAMATFERLGDARTVVTTQARMADIQFSRGALQEVVVLHEQRMPVLEQLGDVAALAHAKFAVAFVRMQIENRSADCARRVLESLTESFNLYRQLGNANRIGTVGLQLAEVHLLCGSHQQVHALLDELQPVIEPLGRSALDFAANLRARARPEWLGAEETKLISVAGLFTERFAVPRTAVEAAAAAAGVTDCAVLDRLIALGTMLDCGSLAQVQHVILEPRLRATLDPLRPEVASQLALAAIPALDAAMRDEQGILRADQRIEELARLALLADSVDPLFLDEVAGAAARRVHHLDNDAARALHEFLEPALARLDAEQAAISNQLARTLCDCASELGRDDLLERALRTLGNAAATGVEHASHLVRIARAKAVTDPQAAKLGYEQAVALFETADCEHETALAKTGIADILAAQGELDPALGLFEAALQVLQRLGHMRSVAITQGKVAEILRTRGDLDRALQIRLHEQLPIFEHLGDVRQAALTQCKIAEILQQSGQLEPALQLLRERALVNFEQLGETRMLAVTLGQIADILQTLGDLEQALRIRIEQQLPAYQSLGLAHEATVAQLRIAELLMACGELEPAAQMLREQVLPAAEALGAREELLTARGLLAQVLRSCRELDAALAVYEQLIEDYTQRNDREGLAHTKYSIATLYLERGDVSAEVAQRVSHDLAEAFMTYVELDRPAGIGHAGLMLAQVLWQADMQEQARLMLLEVEKAFVRIGNESGVTQAQQLRAMIEKEGVRLS